MFSWILLIGLLIGFITGLYNLYSYWNNNCFELEKYLIIKESYDSSEVQEKREEGSLEVKEPGESGERIKNKLPGENDLP